MGDSARLSFITRARVLMAVAIALIGGLIAPTPSGLSRGAYDYDAPAPATSDAADDRA